MNTAMRQYGCDSPNRFNNINSLNNLLDSVLEINPEHSSSSESLVSLLNASIKRQSQSINLSMHKSLNTSESEQEGGHYLSKSAKKHKKKSDSEMGTDIFLNIYNIETSSVHKKKKLSESNESVAGAEVNLSKHKKKKKKHKEELCSNDESKKKKHLADLNLVPTRASKNIKNIICFSGDIISDSSVTLQEHKMDNSAVVPVIEQTKGKKHKMDTSVVEGQTECKEKKHKNNPEMNRSLVNAVNPILNFEHNSEGKKQRKKKDKVDTTSVEGNSEAVEQSVGKEPKKHKVDTSKSEDFEHNLEGKKKYKKKDKMHTSTSVEGNSEAVEQSVGKKHQVDASESETAAGQIEGFEHNLEEKKKHKKKDKMHTSTSIEDNSEAVEQSVGKKHKVDASESETAAGQFEGFEHNLEGKKKHKKKDKMHTSTSLEDNSEAVEQSVDKEPKKHKMDTSKSETAAGQTEDFEHNLEGKKKHKKKDKMLTSTIHKLMEVLSMHTSTSIEGNIEAVEQSVGKKHEVDTSKSETAAGKTEDFEHNLEGKKKHKKKDQIHTSTSIGVNSEVVEQSLGKKDKVDTSESKTAAGQTEGKKKKHKKKDKMHISTSVESNSEIVEQSVGKRHKVDTSGSETAAGQTEGLEHNSEGKKKHKKKDNVNTSIKLESIEVSSCNETNSEEPKRTKKRHKQQDTVKEPTCTNTMENKKKKRKKKHLQEFEEGSLDSLITGNRTSTCEELDVQKNNKSESNFSIISNNKNEPEPSTSHSNAIELQDNTTLEVNDQENPVSFKSPESIKMSPHLHQPKLTEKTPLKQKNTSLQTILPQSTANVSSENKKRLNSSDPDSSTDKKSQTTPQKSKKKRKEMKRRIRLDSESTMTEIYEEDLPKTLEVNDQENPVSFKSPESIKMSPHLHESKLTEKIPLKQKNTSLQANLPHSTANVSSKKKTRLNSSDLDSSTDKKSQTTPQKSKKKRKEMKSRIRLDSESTMTEIYEEDLPKTEVNDQENPVSFKSPESIKMSPHLHESKLTEKIPLKQKNTSLQANLPHSTANVSSKKKTRLNSSDLDSSTDKKSQTTPQKSKKKRKEIKSRMYLDSESTTTETDEEDLPKTLEVNDQENPVSSKSSENIKISPHLHQPKLIEKTPLKQKNTSLQTILPQSTANVSSENKKRLNSSDPDSSTDKKSQTTPRKSKKKRKVIKSRMYVDSESSMTETDEEDLPKTLELNDQENPVFFKSPGNIKMSPHLYQSKLTEKTPLKQKKMKRLNSSDPDSSIDKKSQTTPQKSKNKRKEMKSRMYLDLESTMTETDEEDLPKNDTKARYKLLNDSLYEALDRNRLTAKEMKVLQKLQVDITFDIPVTHTIETRMSSCPTKEQQAKFKSLEIKLRTGPYTSVEDQIIKDNWANFCKTHHLPDKPVPFFTFMDGSKSLLPTEERIAFVQFLGQNLPHRMLYSIHTRFKKLFQTSNKKGKFTPEEDRSILSFMEHSTLENKFSALSRILQRSRISIKKHYDMLCANDDTVKWNMKLKEELIENLMEVTKKNVVDDLKDFTIEMIHWQKIEHKMNIPATKLREKWITNIYPRLFVENFNTTEVQEKLINILYDNYDDDFKAVSWNEVALDFEGMTGRSLYKMFKTLLRKRVPRSLQNNFKNAVDYLKHQYLMEPEKRMKSKFRRLSYEKGKLVQVV